MEVHRRRAAALSAPDVLRRYEADRHAAPSAADPRAIAALDAKAFAAAHRFEPLDLSPVAPLGTVAALAGLHQDAVLSTVRGSEVLADSTNVLALDAARRRRARRDETVRLCAAHRVLRPAGHFRLFALATAGRATGGHGFELAAILEHLGVLLALLDAAGAPAVRASVTALPGGPAPERIEAAVLAPLRAHGRDATLDPGRTRATGYYAGACFEVFVDGRSRADGGGGRRAAAASMRRRRRRRASARRRRPRSRLRRSSRSRVCDRGRARRRCRAGRRARGRAARSGARPRRPWRRARRARVGRRSTVRRGGPARSGAGRPAR